jgi:hypothetical protein
MSNGENKVEPKYGLRYNDGKVDLTQLSPLVQELEARVFGYGEIKYKRDNWKYMKATEKEAEIEYMASMKRHLLKVERGEWLDPESKQPHLAHVIWNVARLLDLHYFGMNHMKDGKDLFHQPYRHELPPVVTRKNFKEIFGFDPPEQK